MFTEATQLPTFTNAGSFEFLAAASLQKNLSGRLAFATQPGLFDTQGNWHRLLTLENTCVFVRVQDTGVVSWISNIPVAAGSVQERLKRLLKVIPLPPHAVEHIPSHLAEHFIALSPLVQISSPSLAEALIKAIIRQVISAEQARKVLHRFVTTFGASFEVEGVRSYDFPPLEKIVQLPISELIACGLGFKAKVVQHVSRVLLEEELEQRILTLPVAEAITLLQSIKGVGEWTSHITALDFMQDLSMYPYNDLAVRKWARVFWPEVTWPDQPAAFATTWEQANSEYVSVITCYLLSLAQKYKR